MKNGNLNTKIEEIYIESFNKIMDESKYEDIRPFVIFLYSAYQKKSNSLSKSTCALIQIFIGVNIGLLYYIDKSFQSPEFLGLVLSTSLLIIVMFLINFIGDTN